MNPYRYALDGVLRITAFQDLDIGVKHPESFQVVKDFVTT